MFSFTTTLVSSGLFLTSVVVRRVCFSSAFHVCILHKSLSGMGEWMSYLLKPENQIRIGKELS